jgi:hypothetical protein
MVLILISLCAFKHDPDPFPPSSVSQKLMEAGVACSYVHLNAISYAIREVTKAGTSQAWLFTQSSPDLPPKPAT